MELPKFLMADNTDFPDRVFVVHTEYPSFIIDLSTDEIEWLEDVEDNEEEDLTSFTEELINQASVFYDREVSRYNSEICWMLL